MHRRSQTSLFALAALAAAVPGLAVCQPGETEASGPNVVFILTDNQAATTLATYGNRDAKTPHIDALARRGARFTHAYQVTGTCSPGRATLLTGLLPSQHGVNTVFPMVSAERLPAGQQIVQEFPTLPLAFRDAGYRTAMVGKWHLGDSFTPSLGFEYWVSFPHGHTTDFYNNEVIDNGRPDTLTDRHIVDYFAEKAASFIREHDGERPFYLQLSLDGPYALPPAVEGAVPQNRHWAEYESLDFESMPARRPAHEALYQERVLTFREAFERFRTLNPWRISTSPDEDVDEGAPRGGTDRPELVVPESDRGEMFLEAFEEWARYHFLSVVNNPVTYAALLAEVSIVDDAVGTVVRALEEKGVTDNTLIIFSTDQANLYGQHGLWGHTTTTFPSHLYEDAVRIPLILVHPSRIPRDRTITRFVSQYDLPATIADYVGLDGEFGDSPGRSFVSLVSDRRETEWTDEVYLDNDLTRGVRTPRYSYWKRAPGAGPDVLFDMEKDPGQTESVVDDPAYADVVSTLEAKLDGFFEKHVDPRYDLWQCGTTKVAAFPFSIHRFMVESCGDEWVATVQETQVFGETEP